MKHSALLEEIKAHLKVTNYWEIYVVRLWVFKDSQDLKKLEACRFLESTVDSEIYQG